MPIGRYFHGHGSEVLKSMKEQYGPEEGERIFYATANKRGEKPAMDAESYARLHRALDYVLDCMKARLSH